MKHALSLASPRATALTTLQKVLLSSDGTMTSLLEALTGEKIRIQNIDQQVVRDGPSSLQLPHRARILKRTVVLGGKHASYVVADSLLVLDRLPSKIQQDLIAGDELIGRLLMRYKVETFREILTCGLEPAGLIGKHFGLAPTTEILSRTSLVHHLSKPLGLITERFPTHIGSPQV